MIKLNYPNRKLGILYILHSLNDGYYSGLLLFLPFIAKDLSLSLFQVGFLATLLNFVTILVALPSGYIAAKFGSLKTIFLGVLLYISCFILLGGISNYAYLALIFLIAGIGFGIFHPIGFAVIAKMSDVNNRGRLIGNFTAIGDLGRIGISSIITFIIVSLGWNYTAALFGFCALLITIFIARIRKNDDSQASKKNITVNLKLIEMLKNKRLIYAICISLLDTLASSSLFIFLPFLLLKRGANPGLLGSFTAVYFIGNIFGKTFLGRFADKHGNTKVFILSELIMVLAILLMTFIPVLTVIIIASLVLGMVSKGTAPVFLTMISEAVEKHGNYEKVFGLNGIATGTANTLAPVFLGVISDVYGIEIAFTFMAFFALSTIFPAVLFHNSRKYI